MKRRGWKVTSFLLVPLLLHSPIAAVSHAAAGHELSPAAKVALTKMTEDAESAQASTINSLYSDLITLQNRSLQRDNKLKQMQTKNKEKLAAIRSKLRQWDIDKINRLETVLMQTRQRYDSLFASYKLLNGQLSRVGSTKKDEKKEALRYQRNIAQAALQLARLDIKGKVATVKNARNNKSKVVKRVRDILTGTHSVKAQMKLERSNISKWNKCATPVWKTLSQAVKKGDAKHSLQSLTSLVSLIRQIDHSKKKLEQHEEQIADILDKAKAVFP